MENTTLPLLLWKVEVSDRFHGVLQSCLTQFWQQVATKNSAPSRPSDVAYIPLTAVASLFNYLLELNIEGDMIAEIVESFQRCILSTEDIHTMSTRLDSTCRQELLESYFQISKSQKPRVDSGLIQSVKNGHASLSAVFGGQGTHNATGLNELRSLYQTYTGLLEDLIQSASLVLKNITTSSNLIHNLGPQGLDLMLWIKQPKSAPNAESLSAAPISFPMNGLISFSHYWITCRILGMHPGEFRDNLNWTTGHSQGIIVAAAVAGSNTWAELLNAMEDSMQLLFWLGWESHNGISSSSFRTATQHSEEIRLHPPTPMLSVRGIGESAVEKVLKECNEYLNDEEKAFLGLINSSDSMVISGPEKTLIGIRKILERRSASSDSNQDKILYLNRKPDLDCQFLPISAPFHSSHLENAYRRVLARIGSTGLFESLDLRIPLYHTSTGEDIHLALNQSPVSILARAVLCEPVHWPKACKQSFTTHILDFGPGRTATLLHDHFTGSGRRVIIASESMVSSQNMGGKHEIFSPQPPIMNSRWDKLYSPAIVHDKSGGTQLVTRMTKVLGTPPVMVGGMTPTTVPADFVSCVMNAGYHIELACGGYSQPQDLEQAIKLLSTKSKGRGITLNVIYAAPRAIAWQIPLIRRLRSEGYPIEGLCIGAGVPSPEIVKEYIDTLKLKHIGLKPSSVNSILSVLEIAKENPNVPVLLQWMGGRSGGHHSYEDFYEPLLNTYESIRKHSNMILIVGSGLGDAKGMMPLLTGEWSESRGYPRMPVDGILIGSRMMVAKEAHTSSSVKSLIVQTPGVSDSEWHKSYTEPVGGVITVRSEMGEPIHKIANRAVMLWHDLDNTIFNVKDTEKRVQLLQSRRAEIINRLNQDYAKPWFAMNSFGKPVTVEDMTYAECLQRITTLMYMHQYQEWIHDSYRVFFFDFMKRVQERFHIQEELTLDRTENPFDLLEKLFDACPSAATDILYPEDASFFLGLCKRRGQKPVNFIPILDADFQTWFKKDSLWQIEKLEAVIDEDPQRVCIIHGPVAASFSNSADEPAGEILNNIRDGLVEALKLTHLRDNSVDLGELAASSNMEATPLLPDLEYVDLIRCKTQRGTKVDCLFKQSLSQAERRRFFQSLDIGLDHWLEHCLNDEFIFDGQQRKPNRVRGALQPCLGDKLTIEYVPSNKKSLNAAFFPSSTEHADNRAAFKLSSVDGIEVRFEISASSPMSSILSLDLHLQEKAGQYSVHDMTDSHETRMRDFYASFWSLDNEAWEDYTTNTEFSAESAVLSPWLVSDFLSLMSRAKGDDSGPRDARVIAPLDLAIVVAWKVLSKPLLVKGLGGDLSRLLHLSNTFEMMPGAKPLAVGDQLQTRSGITAVILKPQGKLVEVTATIIRDGIEAMKIISEFLIQGQFSQHDLSFQFFRPKEWKLPLDSPKLLGLCHSRPWFNLDSNCPELLGRTLLFKITSHREHIPSTKLFALQTKGTISLITDGNSELCVGNVAFSHDRCSDDPVIDFLERYGSLTRQVKPLENPGWHNVAPLLLRVRDFGREYSTLSTDHNPIHVSPSFAGFSGLSQPIIHGMYTSAVVRSKVEDHFAAYNFSRFCRWSTVFEDVVCGDDLLRIEIHHRGMVSANMVFDIQVWNDASNAKVLTAEAEVEQPATAYIFCGQGSQRKDMGMTLYEVDDSAKAIWDRGDRYLFDLYGFSILDIVRNNPKKITVHFGTKKGRQIRSNYLALTRTQVINGQEVTEPVIRGLDETSNSITFEEPDGLLFSTQFAQPLISIVNVAEMAALRSRDLVQEGSIFAGHSLGEYSALLACSDFMTVESLLGLTFYRGLVMQNQMTQDADGRTDFSMVAVNPSRIHKKFDQASLKTLVEVISNTSGLLLEVVNYNVAGQQYVCAGHLRSLWILQKACDDIASSNKSLLHTAEEIDKVVARHLQTAFALPSPVELQRGRATIPLSGVNVPFHSSYLRDGIPVYRRYLQSKIRKQDIDVNRLVGKYVPNLTGKTFSTDREYVEEVAQATGSQVLTQILVDWVA